MRKKLTIIAGILIILFIVVWTMRPREEYVEMWRDGEYVTVHIGADRVIAEIASSPEARARGLGGRSSLEHGYGMLFRFPGRTETPFWMKDMLFALDMVWIDTDRVVGLSRGIEPPIAASPVPRVVYPPAPVTHVLEVSAGEARFIKAGDLVQFRR